MNKILLISFLFLLGCSTQDRTLTFKVNCENFISVNDVIINLKQAKKLVDAHHSKYNSEAKFKVETCNETSVKVLIDLKNIIKPKRKTK